MGSKEGGDVRISRFQSQDLRSTWTGSEHALAWLEGPDIDRQVAVSLVQADGDIHWEPMHVAGVGSNKNGLALAWTGSELGLAWGDARDSNPDCEPDSEIPCAPEIYFNRVGFCD